MVPTVPRVNVPPAFGAVGSYRLFRNAVSSVRHGARCGAGAPVDVPITIGVARYGAQPLRDIQRPHRRFDGVLMLLFLPPRRRTLDAMMRDRAREVNALMRQAAPGAGRGRSGTIECRRARLVPAWSCG
jgi:hypothetical protein